MMLVNNDIGYCYLMSKSPPFPISVFMLELQMESTFALSYICTVDFRVKMDDVWQHDLLQPLSSLMGRMLLYINLPFSKDYLYLSSPGATLSQHVGPANRLSSLSSTYKLFPSLSLAVNSEANVNVRILSSQAVSFLSPLFCNLSFIGCH